MRLFHGTTIENMVSILENGFNQTQVNWTPSESNKTYFFTEEFFNNEYEIESDEDLIAQAIPYTMDQARITLAVQNPKDYRGAVLVFESEYMNNGNELETDTSCENMDHCAVALENPDMNGLVAVYIMKHDESSTRLFQLSALKNNKHLIDIDLSPMDYALVNALSNSDLNVIYELNDMNIFEQYPIKLEFNSKKAA